MSPQTRAMHTIQSHGVEIARFHVYDWLVLIVLLALESVLELVIDPFHQFVSKDMMAGLKHPLKANTVPMWTVPLYAGLLPIVIFVVFYFRRRNVYDLHNAVLGLMYAILMTAVMTSGIKNAVGRPRPDFFWRCFPDGNEMYDSVGNVICNGQESVITEGYKSFPSGHSSMSFAGLGFVSLYLAAKMKAFDEKGHIAKLCVVIIPLLAATMVAISRVDDYWHHWQDVFVGAFLGFVVALLCYHQFFPPPYHVNGSAPTPVFLPTEPELPEHQPSPLTSSSEGLDVIQTPPISQELFVPFNESSNCKSGRQPPCLENGETSSWNWDWIRAFNMMSSGGNKAKTFPNVAWAIIFSVVCGELLLV